MRDPERFLGGSAGDLAATLIAAGATETPQRRALVRTLRAVAGGSAVAEIASSMSSSAAAASSAATGPVGSVAPAASKVACTLTGQGTASATAAASGQGAAGAAALQGTLSATAPNYVGVAAKVTALGTASATGTGAAASGMLVKWLGIGVIAVTGASIPGPSSAPSPLEVPRAQVVEAATAGASSKPLFDSRGARMAQVARQASGGVPSEDEGATLGRLRITTQGCASLEGSATPRCPDTRRQTARRRPPADQGVTSTLAAETRLIDAARAALREGEPERALGLLARYESQYPRSQLAPELYVLRMEARVVQGDEEQARRLARQVLESPGATSHSQRAQEVLNHQASR